MNVLNLIRLSAVSLVLLATQVALALPSAFQANYTVSKGSMTLGNLQTSLRYNGNNYHYSKSTKTTGIAKLLSGVKIAENTAGQFFGEKLKPKNYLYNQTKRTKSRVEKAHFNGTKVTGSYKGKPFDVKVPANTLDRASLELALARDLSANKSQLTYSVIEKGRIKQYRFVKQGHEKITTKVGVFNTVKVSVVRSNKKRQTSFWLAKELGFMPVKIQHNEKGDLISTVLKSYKAL